MSVKSHVLIIAFTRAFSDVLTSLKNIDPENVI